MDMALVIVSASVTSFILILLLLGPLGKNADLKARRISDAVRKVKVEKYEELENLFTIVFLNRLFPVFYGEWPF